MKKVKTKELTMVVTGEEKSQEEIVWNNLMRYMNATDVEPEMQISYLKNTILYLEYEKKKNKIINTAFVIPAAISFLGFTGAFFAGNSSLASSLFIASGALTFIGAGIKLIKRNPYESIINSYGEINEKQFIYRKITPFIK